MTNSQVIVSAQWLSENLERSDLTIVDCRFQLTSPEWGQLQYAKSHIPHAYYLDLNLDLSSPVSDRGGRHPLPNTDLLAKKLANLGIIAGETLVVIYDDARFAFVSRLWWLLRYLGHERVVLLDGGWNAWLEGGYPVVDLLPQARSGQFIPNLNLDWVVNIDRLKNLSASSSTILLDSREPERYRGEKEPIDPIAGSIPGAVNAPWKNTSDERGYFLPPLEQEKLWQDYRQTQEIIVYCGSGVTACVNLLSLYSCGFSNTKLYVGGWSDWCSYLT
jgi:thiosulfate/3-mercaptopyruvate sulfurtransferase